MADGQVYVFNTYNEQLTLSINGFSGGDIPAWSDGTGGTTKYTPSAKAFPIVKHLDDASSASFGYNAANELTIRWEDPGQYNVSVQLPGPGQNVSITNDIIIYIAYNKVILMNTNGFVLSTTTIGTPPK
ncbi:MAG: hypothetical protein DWQ02_07655 [Bacteroidetes bacterium]|nr:MAG: hypothetical protein DWQ02_07655 [Bacteroidota bacterium]